MNNTEYPMSFNNISTIFNIMALLMYIHFVTTITTKQYVNHQALFFHYSQALTILTVLAFLVISGSEKAPTALSSHPTSTTTPHTHSNSLNSYASAVPIYSAKLGPTPRQRPLSASNHTKTGTCIERYRRPSDCRSSL